MQNITFYVAANETLGQVRDYANAKSASPPTLVRGVEACLKMRLFARKDGREPYPLDALSGIVSWQWAMDNDFNESTTYKLTGDNAHISVAGIVELIDGEEVSYTEIAIPIPDMNTEELASWLGIEKSKTGLHGELLGLDAQGRQVFILQVENFTVRNRITSLGNPTPISPDYLTAGQVAALLASGMECEFSSDGESWHTLQTELDILVHFRLRSSGGLWSDAVELLVGPRGLPGLNAYCYVAYASDSSGTGFSLTPSGSLKYRAEIHPTEPISELSAADFAGAWVKYLGDDGAGVGDMTKALYDSDDDGKVDAAERADEADAVAWNNVTEKPASFTPTGHLHTMAAISDPVRQAVQSEASPAALYLNRPILMNSSANTNPTLAIEITSVKTSPGGDDYSAISGDFFTWEFHYKASVDITSIAIGGLNSSMVPITIPDSLPRINASTTVHVFVIRGIYQSGAVSNLILQVNYAYSYGA